MSKYEFIEGLCPEQKENWSIRVQYLLVARMNTSLSYKKDRFKCDYAERYSCSYGDGEQCPLFNNAPNVL